MRNSVGGGLAHSRGGYLAKTTPIRAEFKKRGLSSHEKRSRTRFQKAVLRFGQPERIAPRSLANLRLRRRSDIAPSRVHTRRLEIPQCLCRPPARQLFRRHVGVRAGTHAPSKPPGRSWSSVRRATCLPRE